MNEAKTQTSKKNVEVSSLKSIAIFLEGVKQGRGGNLLPLGNNDLEQLWNAIAFLQGDERFECRDFKPCTIHDVIERFSGENLMKQQKP